MGSGVKDELEFELEQDNDPLDKTFGTTGVVII